MNISVDKKTIKFDSFDVKLFTEMLNDLRFSILNTIYDESLEKDKLFDSILLYLIELDENSKKLEKAYNDLLKHRYIEINSDNKIEITEYGKIIVDLYHERQKFKAYQYNSEKEDYVLVKNFFEYRNGKKIIPTDQELMNIYVLFRGGKNYNTMFSDSTGMPCSLKDATLFNDYNKAYEFLRECYTIKHKNFSDNFIGDFKVFSVYELNTTTEFFGIRKFENGSKLINKNASLTVLNGHLTTYGDVKKFIL